MIKLMKSGTLSRELCKTYCQYYKPSKEEGLACRGFVVVKRLIEMGKQISFEGPNRRSGPLTEADLRKDLCPSCQFYKSDCDFILQEGAAMPCGGFILLGLLIENGMICIDDVRDIE